MKTKLSLIFAFLFGLTAMASAADEKYKLGAGALVLETKEVAPNRALVLWMVNPKKNPRETPDEPYTCPEYTRGSYYSGPTRVSLVDPQTGRVINTLKILSEESDSFDLPYAINGEHYYHVEGAAKGTDAKPTILFLKDYNGDGKATEFALFDAQACMGLATTLIGYSEHQDKVVQYQTHLSIRDSKGKKSDRTERWTDYLFSKEAQSPGVWKFEIDYRGRGGVLAKYDVHYDKKTERFEGTLVETGDE
ncbi:MAG: hypothetical protein QOH88_60 [Verrucomicrobiota bacterium]|jgi:hypothetical protein